MCHAAWDKRARAAWSSTWRVMVVRAARSSGGGVGLIGGNQRDEQPVVDVGLEHGDADALIGEHTAVDAGIRRISPFMRRHRRS